MKKILILGWVMLFLLSACEEDKNNLSPEERPDARLNQLLEEYKGLLTGAEWGWKATLYTGEGVRYNFLFSFAENDRVKMLGDINATTAAEEYESTYRLKAMQQPALLFDTYSYLHILSDPDESKSGGVRGEGRYSDFEFYFEEATEEVIELRGNYNGSLLILERATQADNAAYTQKITETIAAFEKLNALATYFKRLTFGGNELDVEANTAQRTISFLYYEGNTQRSFTSGFYYSEDGIILQTPFSNGNITISSLEDLIYNAAEHEINLTINGSAANIQEATSPIVTDPDAGGNFYNNFPNGSYIYSVTGFTIENEVDVFDVFSIPNYYYLIFFPQFGPLEENGSETFDLLGFITVNQEAQSLEIAYGPALQTNILNDGKISFTHAGSFDAEEVEMPAAVKATLEQFVIPEGYYAVQTQNGFDLVSAKDARTWISFFGF